MLYAVLAALTLAACGPDDGWRELPSGYKYQIVTNTDGEKPQTGDKVFLHATMMAGDSLLFDSRSGGAATPIELMPKDAPRSDLSPIMDLLYELSVGDSARLVYPIDSFDSPQAQIEGHSEVMYIVKVTDIMDDSTFREWQAVESQRRTEDARLAKAREAEVQTFVDSIYAAYKAGELDGQITRTESGLGYLIHEEGTPGTAPGHGDPVTAHYYGLIDATGEHFQNSFNQGTPFTFAVGTGPVIPGWHEGFALLNEGATATLFIPSELAYGEEARPPLIKPNSDLIFYVEHLVL